MSQRLGEWWRETQARYDPDQGVRVRGLRDVYRLCQQACRRDQRPVQAGLDDAQTTTDDTCGMRVPALYWRRRGRPHPP